MTTARDRNLAQDRGLFSETIGAWCLRLKGYRILARRFRTPVGEIDIVARRGRLLVFVEVKARADTETAAASIGHTQQDRISRAAQVFVQDHPDLAGFDMRFDALLFGKSAWPRHIVDAWRPGD